jgi:hypothetical protein
LLKDPVARRGKFRAGHIKNMAATTIDPADVFDITSPDATVVPVYTDPNASSSSWLSSLTSLITPATQLVSAINGTPAPGSKPATATTATSTLTSNLPLILGGVGVLIVVLFFAFRKN